MLDAILADEDMTLCLTLRTGVIRWGLNQRFPRTLRLATKRARNIFDILTVCRITQCVGFLIKKQSYDDAELA